jgi:hypothetical protein
MPAEHLVSMVDTLEYEVVSSFGRLELRRYPLTILASVKGAEDDDAFSLLFSYISGENSMSEKVPMTTPVVSSRPRPVKIAMTTPVLSDPGSFSFVLPSSYSPSSAPEPADPRVSLEILPPRRLAVLRFRGRTGERVVAERSRELLRMVDSARLRRKGEPFLMRYNPPFIPGLFRRNEVAVEVAEDDAR